jgi:single-strand DNA-binding protein
MASLNKVLLIGNLTRDPEVRVMSNGKPVCNFGLALNRSYKNAEGNRKEETTFVDVECFGPRAEAVGRFFTKGRAIFVEGRLKLDQWESKEGEKRSALRVVLDNFEFVDSRQESSGAGKPYESPKDSPAVETATSPEPETPPSPEPETPPVSPANDPDLEEDVPF